MSRIMTRLVDNINSKRGEAADEIAESVHALMHLYRARQYRKARDGQHELTPMEGRVLGFFGRHPGATQSDLVTHAARDKGQLARLISALRERGLLEVRLDETDRRVQRLYLTTAGTGVQAAVQRQRLRVARLAVADLDEDERSMLAELLRRVRTKLEAAG
jgi:DNA-binding MarR family transcriptional regulator